MRRERREHVLISVGLLIAAFVMYLYEDTGWTLALSFGLSAIATTVVYWIARC